MYPEFYTLSAAMAAHQDQRITSGQTTNEDEQPLIERESYALLNEDASGDVLRKKMLREKLIKRQRRYLLWHATMIPAVKFIAAMIMLSLFIADGKLGNELAQQGKNRPMDKVFVLFIYIIVTIPLSAILLILGTMIFSNFPRITTTTVNGYVAFRCLLVALEVAGWIGCAIHFSASITENFAFQLAAMTEVYSVVLLKLSTRKRFNLDPLEEPSAMEMATVKTNLP